MKATRAVKPAVSMPAELQVEQVPIEQLRPWEGNPRCITDQEMAKLRRSLSQWGLVQPLVVRRADSTIIGGHQRWEAARTLGHARVPVVYVDLSEAEAKALNLALNKIQGEWDLPKLGELLAELQELPELDETLTDFDGREIESLLADLARTQLAPPTKRASTRRRRCSRRTAARLLRA